MWAVWICVLCLCVGTVTMGSLQAAWNHYSNSCKCGYRYENNCAHFLSDALIKGGIRALDGGYGGNFRNVNGMVVCRAGRQVRAKELRNWFRRHENPSTGRGHVLLKKINGKYRGTGDFAGRRYIIQEYYTLRKDQG